MKKPLLKFNVLFRTEPEGGFTATVPSLPGCISYGKTLEKAKAMITDAAEGYIASLRAKKQKVPSDNGSFMSTIDFSPKIHA